MTKPNNPQRLPLPSNEIDKVYAELIDELECTCAAGAKIKASPLPSATVNLGDIIADQTRILTTFTSTYSVVTVILRMISCMIDVICAIMNPFSLIFAIIRLFGTCLPDFILIFPQLAIPAKIVCIIKIILAIVEYITTVIIPIIEEIISNIQNLIDAFDTNNRDAQLAIALKIATLFKEILNIIGILSTLKPIWEMIQALLNLGISLPCSGSGGSCVNCGDDNSCPAAIQQTNHTGTDGQMIVIYGYEIFNFEMYFKSASKRNDFLSIRDFFPRGLDYTEIKNTDDLPYTLTVDGNTFAVTSINTEGTLNLFQISTELATDGYLSLTTGAGFPLPDPTKDVRLGTPTNTFTSLMENTRYVTINDTNSYNILNSGTWKITKVYDSYNAVLRREDGESWSASSQVYWRIAPTAPQTGTGKTFRFDINHNELIRHNLINLGCHPSVKAEKDALSVRFSAIADNYGTGLGLPDFPNINNIINLVTSCVTNVVPTNVNAQYILDNYGTIANNVASMGSCIEDNLSSFQDELIDYGKKIYPRLFDPESTANSFTVSQLVQIVGYPITASLIAYDRYNEILGKGFPEDVVHAEIFSSAGEISQTTGVFDIYGKLTGKYTASVTSDIPRTITLTAKVANIYVSDFDGYNLIPKEIEVEFITTSEMQRRKNIVISEVSSESLNSVGG